MSVLWFLSGSACLCNHSLRTSSVKWGLVPEPTSQSTLWLEVTFNKHIIRDPHFPQRLQGHCRSRHTVQAEEHGGIIKTTCKLLGLPPIHVPVFSPSLFLDSELLICQVGNVGLPETVTTHRPLLYPSSGLGLGEGSVRLTCLSHG